MNNKEKIAEIQKEITYLKEQISEKYDRVFDLLIEDHPWEVGLEVKLPGGKKGKVIHFRKVSRGTIYPVVSYYRKDGSLGLRQETVYNYKNWEVCN